VTDLPSFPKIPESLLKKMLEPPKPPVRIVIDSDVDNEVDDYFALTWILQSPESFRIEGIYAAPYSFRSRVLQLNETYAIVQRGGPTNEREQKLVDRYGSQVKAVVALGLIPPDLLRDEHVAGSPERGMLESFTRTREICTVLGLSHGSLLFAGSDRYLGSPAVPVESPAALHLIERARASSPEEPLYVVALACLTNIVSAILLAPDIIRNIVVVWTAGYPTNVTTLANTSFNTEQDVPASQLLFACGVPVVYLPGFYIGQQLTLSLPDVEMWVRGRGDIGDLLYQRFVANPLFDYYGIASASGVAFTWVIWDLICVGWLINSGWVSTALHPSPVLTDDLFWKHAPGRSVIREATGISRTGIFKDLFTKLAQPRHLRG
jgi:purine nucleosidase